MRMWLVDPKVMCKNHLLGEHLELHMLAGCLKKGKSIKGYVEGGLVDPLLLSARHKELVSEMKRRGYCHSSAVENLPKKLTKGQVNADKNILELARRCPECKRLQEESL